MAANGLIFTIELKIIKELVFMPVGRILPYQMINVKAALHRLTSAFVDVSRSRARDAARAARPLERCTAHAREVVRSK